MSDLHNTLTRIDNLEEGLMKENARLRAALIAAHEALQASSKGSQKDRAVQATLRILAQARKA